MMLRGLLALAFALLRRPRLTLAVVRQMDRAMKGGREASSRALAAASDWLLAAQANCPDGPGYSRRFRVGFGWDRGYVETTGYIIPTLLEVATRLGDDRYRRSALAAGEWLLARQNRDGSFSEIDRGTPQAFDTGQVLLGLNALAQAADDRPTYVRAAERAAQWLGETMNPDGTWTDVAYAGRAHTYYSRSAAALLQTGISLGREDLVQAAHRHLQWVRSRQTASGWFLDCEFEIGRPALLHTIVYVMEGLLHAHELAGRKEYLEAACRAARALRDQAAVAPHGVPAGYYARDWVPASAELCITGIAQWAGVCRRLHRIEGGGGFDVAANCSLDLLHALQIRDAGPLCGALPNVVPWWGSYGKMGAFNWNTKFFIDALLVS